MKFTRVVLVSAVVLLFLSSCSELGKLLLGDQEKGIWQYAGNTPENATIHGIAFIGKDTFMTGYDASKIYQIENESIIRQKNLAYKPTGLTTDGNNLWITSDQTQKIEKLDVNGNQLLSINVPNSADSTGLYYSNGSLWTTGFYGKIYNVSIDGTIIKEFNTESTNNEGLVIVNDEIYVIDWTNEKILVYSMEGVKQSEIKTPVMQPLALGYDGTYLWITGYGNSKMFKYKL